MSLCRALSGGLFWWPFLVTVISYCVLHKLNEWMFDTPPPFPPILSWRALVVNLSVGLHWFGFIFHVLFASCFSTASNWGTGAGHDVWVPIGLGHMNWEASRVSTCGWANTYTKGIMALGVFGMENHTGIYTGWHFYYYILI